MKLTSLIVTELKQESELTRRALELVPEGKNDGRRIRNRCPLGNWRYGCDNAFMDLDDGEPG